MKALSDFVPEMRLELPHCPEPVIEFHLLRVARDFCNRTNAWQDTFPTITAADVTLSYFLVLSEAKAELARPMRLTVNGELLWAAIEPPECEDQPQFRADQPPFSINADGDQITLRDQPAGDIVLAGSMRPSLAATTLPDFLLNDYSEAMRFGTLARLLAMASKPWTDRDAAGFYGVQFDRRCTAAATKAQNGNTRKLLRTRAWG